MYIKYNHEISSIKKFISIEIEHVNLNKLICVDAEFWYLNAKVNDINEEGYNIKEHQTREEAEKELENIAKAIEEGKHIYTIK